jgi:hypothetical protein
MRWRDYVLEYDDQIPELWDKKRTHRTFLLGAGFDPRALVGLRAYANATVISDTTVVVIDLPPGRADSETAALAEENAQALQELVTTSGCRLERIPYPASVDRRATGQAISRAVQGGGLIDPDGLVLVDVSGLPASLAFPLIGGMLEAADRGAFDGDLQVLVCENPFMDEAIQEEGSSDPGPLVGFNFGLTDAGRDVIRIWAPVLGEGQEEQLEAIYAYLEPNGITPVLPFPSANPRRADDLLVDLRELLFDRFSVEYGDFIYADETNPFDVYRALWRLSSRTQSTLVPIGESTVVASVHGSKTLSTGVLLAAWEQKLPVVVAPATDYVLTGDAQAIAELQRHNRLAAIWLTGEPYAT